jgi:hypothetical protein
MHVLLFFIIFAGVHTSVCTYIFCVHSLLNRRGRGEMRRGKNDSFCAHVNVCAARSVHVIYKFLDNYVSFGLDLELSLQITAVSLPARRALC